MRGDDYGNDNCEITIFIMFIIACYVIIKDTKLGKVGCNSCHKCQKNNICQDNKLLKDYYYDKK